MKGKIEGEFHKPLSAPCRHMQELQQKRADRAAEVQRVAQQELEALRQDGKVGRKKTARVSPSNKSTAPPSSIKAKNTGEWRSLWVCLTPKGQAKYKTRTFLDR